MSEEMHQILSRKLERRKELAALPVGEKLRMLEEMIAATKAVSATNPPKLAHRVPADAMIEKARKCGPHSPLGG